MQQQPQQQVHDGVTVWVNPTTEPIREAECLCFNCADLKPGQPDNCHIAQALYQICLRENVAFPVTRCPVWKPKDGATSP
jgi:hypothetical protein